MIGRAIAVSIVLVNAAAAVWLDVERGDAYVATFQSVFALLLLWWPDRFGAIRWTYGQFRSQPTDMHVEIRFAQVTGWVLLACASLVTWT